MSIRWKLVVSYSLLLLITLGVGGGVLLSVVRQVLEANVEAELRNSTDTILGMVETAVDASVRNHLTGIAEKNRDIVAHFYDRSRAGEITEGEAKARAAEVLLSQKIADTGYVYAIDSGGVVRVHPLRENVGRNLSAYPFVQQEMRQREGYLQYRWANPGETEARPKAVAMSYFAPWDWIIAVSSYRDEFNSLFSLDRIRDGILAVTFGQTGYPYVIDTNGTVIIHPRLATGSNLLDAKDVNGRAFVREMIAAKSGKIIYRWHEPGGEPAREKLVVFKTIPDLNWIVASTSYVDEFYAPLRTISYDIVVGIVAAMVLLVGLTLVVGQRITAPLHRLMKQFAMASAGQHSGRLEVSGTDEMAQLACYYNEFMDRLQDFTGRLAESEERYALALDGSEDGVWDWDLRHDRVHVSGRFDAFGFEPTKEGMSPDAWMACVHPDDQPRVREAFADHFAGRIPYLHIDYRVCRHDGAVNWVRHRGKAVFGEDGRAYRMAGSVGDITELKQREFDVLELNRTLEERVVQRTEELEAAMADLGRKKAEVEGAYASLDVAHRELNRANTLMLESIRYASKIQDALLPDKSALGRAMAEIEVCWEPLQVVGGDYFWLERIDRRSYLIAADCTGHGVPGAFMTLITASAIDQILRHGRKDAPSVILGRLDEMVRLRLRQDRPETASDDGLDAAVCIWDAERRCLSYGGASVPLFYAKDGEVHEIRGSRGSLGYRTGGRRGPIADHEITVEPGMVFYLLTDGVPDHMGGQPRRLLGRKRLMQMIGAHQGLPLAEQMARLRDDLAAYRGEEPRRDDMTVIIFRPL